MADNITVAGGCPFRGTRIEGAQGLGPTLEDWWPERLRVELLHQQTDLANPLGADFDYAEAFKTINLGELKKDIFELLKTSQDWWPADYGHYGPQMIRMAWHAAGTYRIADGRGGAGSALQRFLPIDSWIDNGNTDKSRRLLWPIKQKYGSALSWADLMVLTGNCALESMGFKTFGFGGGRLDAWQADSATYWGSETEMLGRERWHGDPKAEYYDLENPVAASQMSLIYVNPEGPGGNSDPLSSAREIRETFARMAMNDEETVALIAGGHAFGKSHGAVGKEHIGPAPAAAPIEVQGLGWMNSAGTGNAEFTTTNGIEGAWTSEPTKWDAEYLHNLFNFEWELTESPAGAKQWRPTVSTPDATTPDAHIEGKHHPLMMMTSDIALRADPEYAKICRRYLENMAEFEDAFSRAWYKLTHRDMGPKVRYLGAEVPAESLIWQDPIPMSDYDPIEATDIADLKAKILATGLSVSALVGTAWASASTFRSSDKRGGANGARIRLAPQKDWEVNQPQQLAKVLSALEGVQKAFNDAQTSSKHVSLADLIVLGGCAGVEQAAGDAGVEIQVPFTPGRMDAKQEDTDIESFEWLHPVVDGFRNFQQRQYKVAAEVFLIDRANLLTLTAPQLTALIGGLRTIGINWDGSQHGAFTERPGVLTNDFFVNLFDMATVWSATNNEKTTFEGRDRQTNQPKWTATRTDLVFGSDPQLRAVGEVYAAKDGHHRLVHDFVAAWDKVMMLDRFDVPNRGRVGKPPQG
jgi:catalase-peroxidase